jgi:hypothetical protein
MNRDETARCRRIQSGEHSIQGRCKSLRNKSGSEGLIMWSSYEGLMSSWSRNNVIRVRNAFQYRKPSVPCLRLWTMESRLLFIESVIGNLSYMPVVVGPYTRLTRGSICALTIVVRSPWFFKAWDGIFHLHSKACGIPYPSPVSRENWNRPPRRFQLRYKIELIQYG